MKDKIYEMLNALDLPVTFLMWPINKAPALPYLVYSIGETNSYYADDINLLNTREIVVDVYQDDTNYDLEILERLKNKLTSNNIAYKQLNTVYIDTEKFYQTTFIYSVLEEEK